MTATELAPAANVTISERAAKRIGAILKSEGDGAMLRISVEGLETNSLPISRRSIRQDEAWGTRHDVQT